MPDQILFYSHARNTPFGCFSNFSPHRVTIYGTLYPTSEHAFQVNKYIHNAQYHNIIAMASSPAEAKKLGSSRKIKLRDDWDDVKNNIMYQIVKAKFQQNHDIRKILLSTNNAELIEHTFRDKYWGDGGDGSGRNQLGETLMRVRSEFMNVP